MLVLLLLSGGLSILPTQQTHAVWWVIVKEVLKKVILAIDAQVQQSLHLRSNILCHCYARRKRSPHTHDPSCTLHSITVQIIFSMPHRLVDLSRGYAHKVSKLIPLQVPLWSPLQVPASVP